MVKVKENLQRVLDSQFERMKNLQVLEAGCGSGSNISLPENSYIVGIDISQEELDKNSSVDEKILGDVQIHELPGSAFDLVVCWDVLEHLANPEMALRNFQASIKPGGMLLLAFPNVRSVKALVAKWSPHWFHTAVYRLIYGSKYGDPGYITFPTYLRNSIAPNAIEKFAQGAGLEIIYKAIYESSMQKRFRKKFGITSWRFELLRFLCRIVTFDRYSLENSDCIFLLYRTN